MPATRRKAPRLGDAFLGLRMKSNVALTSAEVSGRTSFRAKQGICFSPPAAWFRLVERLVRRGIGDFTEDGGAVGAGGGGNVRRTAVEGFVGEEGEGEGFFGVGGDA